MESMTRRTFVKRVGAAAAVTVTSADLGSKALGANDRIVLAKFLA